MLTTASLQSITIIGYFEPMKMLNYIPVSTTLSHKHNWQIIMSNKS